MYHVRFSESMDRMERSSMKNECISAFVIARAGRIMKTPLEAPPEQVKAETGVKETPKAGSAPIIDTSKMSAGKAAALELAEASRDPLDERGSFASNLFIGKFGF